MGYRSDVKVLFTLPKGVDYSVVLNEIKEVWGDDKDFYMVFNEIKHNNKMLFLGAEYVKWYKDYEDVERFMQYVYDYPKNHNNSGVDYIRIGEDYEDVKTFTEGECEDWMRFKREIVIPGENWESETIE